jgi:anti-sigma-K factor RskA
VFMTQVNGKASYVVIAPRQFNSYVRFGVSIEPAGGSPGPTGPAALLSEVMR